MKIELGNWDCGARLEPQFGFYSDMDMTVSAEMKITVGNYVFTEPQLRVFGFANNLLRNFIIVSSGNIPLPQNFTIAFLDQEDEIDLTFNANDIDVLLHHRGKPLGHERMSYPEMAGVCYQLWRDVRAGVVKGDIFPLSKKKYAFGYPLFNHTDNMKFRESIMV